MCKTILLYQNIYNYDRYFVSIPAKIQYGCTSDNTKVRKEEDNDVFEDIQLTLGNIQSILGNIQSTLGDIQSTLANIPSTLGNIQSTSGNIQSTSGNILSQL
jgi:peptidoglycan hydrolase CwlO-like protein